MADGSIIIDTKIDNSGAKKDIASLKLGLNSLTETMKKAANASVVNSKSAEAIEKQKSKIDELKAKYDALLSGDKEPKSIKDLERQLKSAQAEMEKAQTAYNDFVSSLDVDIQAVDYAKKMGQPAPATSVERIDAADAESLRLADELEAAREKAETLRAQLDNLYINPSATIEAQSLAASIEQAESKLAGMTAQTAGASGGFSSFAAMAQGSFDRIKTSLGTAAAGFTQFAQNAGDKMGSVVNKVKDLGNKIGGMFSRFMPTAKSSIDGVGQHFDRFYSRVKSLVVRAFIFNFIRKGLQSLLSYMGGVLSKNAQLSASLGQIKGNLQTAFQPIVQAVLPILNAFASALATITGWLAAFLNLLTGRSIKASQAAAKGYNDMSKGLGGAGKAAKKASKQLAAFDEIQKLSAENDAGGSSGGGGGGGAGGIEPSFGEIQVPDWIKNLVDLIKAGDWSGVGSTIAEMLNTQLARLKDLISWDNVGPAITKFITNFADMFNSFVSKFDWSLLGQTIGEGINTIVNTINLFLTSIDWANLGQGFAKGLNGLLDTVNWNNLGAIWGNKITAIFDLLYGFVTDFNWGKLGMAASEYLNGAFEKIDLTKIGTTLAALVNGITGTLINFLRNTDWGKIAREFAQGFNNLFRGINWAEIGVLISDIVLTLIKLISDFILTTDWFAIGNSIWVMLAGIDWGQIIYDLSLAIGRAIGGLGLLLAGFIQDAVIAVGEYFAQKFQEAGGNIIAGLLKGIFDALIGIGNWLYNNVFLPIWRGVCEMFGIASPSKKMMEIGVYLMQGMLNGITSFFSKIFDAMSKLWSGIQNTFRSVGSWFTNIFTGAWNGIKNVWSGVGGFFRGVWSGIQSIFSNITGWFREKFSAAWQTVKNVFSAGGRIFDGIKDGILNGLKAVVNAIIGGINKVIKVPFNGLNSALRRIRSVNIMGARPFGWISEISIPQIPKLAQGAVIPPNREFLAVLGDQKRGVNIETPLDTMIQAFNAALDKKQDNGTTVVNVYLDGALIVKQVNKRNSLNAFATNGGLL